MNMMTAAVGVDSGFSAMRGAAEGAVAIAIFVAVGFVLLGYAVSLIRRHHEPRDIRYSELEPS